MTLKQINIKTHNQGNRVRLLDLTRRPISLRPVNPLKKPEKAEVN